MSEGLCVSAVLFWWGKGEKKFILAGGEGRNTIIGSKGESSLWGGAGTANDFTLSDGSTWTADYSTKTWSRVK